MAKKRKKKDQYKNWSVELQELKKDKKYSKNGH